MSKGTCQLTLHSNAYRGVDYIHYLYKNSVKVQVILLTSSRLSLGDSADTSRRFSAHPRGRATARLWIMFDTWGYPPGMYFRISGCWHIAREGGE
jgi:hypothetical protein